MFEASSFLQLDNRYLRKYIVLSDSRRNLTMPKRIDPARNIEHSKKTVGYISRKNAGKEDYSQLGFRCGLEIHQQLKTDKKLFCRCPAGIYQNEDDYDAEIVRHMRPTLSELGEYDGTALMEFKTKKNIVYRIKNETACTYEIDDTPPFALNRDALAIAMEVALLLKCSVVGELHITRKQYLDGSIPTGFQRTAILGIEGEIPLSNKNIRIIQLSIEEDACREVSDIGHQRIYRTDRLGMPLIETVTYPDMTTPDEAAEAAQYLRFLTRSTNKMNTGIGAAREDVNVSITGGTRVEIKGVSRIKWIPELTHNEAFRQKALLKIRSILHTRIVKPEKWSFRHIEIGPLLSGCPNHVVRDALNNGYKIIAVNLPKFQGLLSFFTQPGKVFANELSDRLKVVACLERPNMTHSETIKPLLSDSEWKSIRQKLASKEDDAQVIFWGPEEDIKTAVETIEERCRLAFEGVPNETRKSLPDGTTLFERVLPGPNRMYPDTDSAPIPIPEAMIENVRQDLPSSVADRTQKMREWAIPDDTFEFILKRNLFPVIDQIVAMSDLPPVFVGTLLGHHLKYLEGKYPESFPLDTEKLLGIVLFFKEKKLKKEILKSMLSEMAQNPGKSFPVILKSLKYQKLSRTDILSRISKFETKFRTIRKSKAERAVTRWIMGQLRPLAMGNMDFNELKKAVPGDGQ
jgi:glutamyl-tRNA(Gln) amidotransferase subunit E